MTTPKGQVLRGALDRNANAPVEEAARPGRRVRDIAELPFAVERDGDAVRRVGADGLANSPVGRVEHVEPALAERAVHLPIEHHREPVIAPLLQRIVHRRLFAPLIQALPQGRVPGCARECLLVGANGGIDLTVVVLDLAQQSRGADQSRFELQRAPERLHGIRFVSEQVGGDADAEMQRGVARILDERFAKGCRGSVTVASLKGLPASLCPRGSRRLSVQRNRHQRDGRTREQAFQHSPNLGSWTLLYVSRLERVEDERRATLSGSPSVGEPKGSPYR